MLVHAVSLIEREPYITFVCKIDEHELIVLFASTAGNIKTYCGHTSGQTTLDEVVDQAEFVYLHCGILQVLDYIQWMACNCSNCLSAYI